MPSRSRRRFLQATSTAAAAATAGFFSSRSAVRGQSPNARPRVAVVGCGGQGTGDGRQALRFGDIVAVCDVDTAHSTRARDVYAEMTAAKGKAADIAVWDAAAQSIKDDPRANRMLSRDYRKGYEIET